jgi:hypothetical protein
MSSMISHVWSILARGGKSAVNRGSSRAVRSFQVRYIYRSRFRLQSSMSIKYRNVASRPKSNTATRFRCVRSVAQSFATARISFSISLSVRDPHRRIIFRAKTYKLVSLLSLHYTKDTLTLPDSSQTWSNKSLKNKAHIPHGLLRYLLRR